jgi:hypothetical protein
VLFCGVLVPYDISSPRRFRVSPVTARTSNIAFVIPVGFKGMADNDGHQGASQLADRFPQASALTGTSS